MDLSLALTMTAPTATSRTRMDDAALVAAARAGDPRAFETLAQRHRDAVLNLAYRIVGDRDAAQDVAQEAIVAAFTQVRRFRGGSAFPTWLYSITVNTARMHLRSQSRRAARQDRWSQLAPPQAEAPEAADDSGPLVALMRELPEKHRIALALFYLQELSVEGIAQAAGAPTGTVKAWLSRGREQLRTLAEARGLL